MKSSIKPNVASATSSTASGKSLEKKLIKAGLLMPAFLAPLKAPSGTFLMEHCSPPAD